MSGEKIKLCAMLKVLSARPSLVVSPPKKDSPEKPSVALRLLTVNTKFERNVGLLTIIIIMEKVLASCS